MKHYTFNKEDIFNGNLLLINSNYPLKDKYSKNKEIIEVGEYCGEKVLMDRTAAKMIKYLIGSINGQNDIKTVSGFRTRKSQIEIYENSLAEKGEEFTKKYVALPGCSEHESGLAIDVGENKKDVDFIRPNFPDKGIFKQFKKLASMYGFIERYPEDKTKITGIAYEPWHFRYVGWPHSVIIKNYGLSLEEYIDELNCRNALERALTYFDNGFRIKIFSQPLYSDSLHIEIPENMMMQYSGNNVNSMVFTTWERD